jgi:hypothetical protein
MNIFIVWLATLLFLVLPPSPPRWLICRQEDGLAAQVCPLLVYRPQVDHCTLAAIHSLHEDNLSSPFARQFRRTSVTTRIIDFKKCSSFKVAPSTLLCLFPLT